MQAGDLERQVGELVEAWCDRRCLGALREILSGYPVTSPLTDSWAELLTALEGVRAFARDELTPQERDRVEHLIGLASELVCR